MSVLLDAGPALNFLAVGQENILIRTADSKGLALAVPQRVEKEILGMCQDARFQPTPTQATWHKLKAAGRIAVLADTLDTQQLIDAVTRISGQPARDRVRSGKSLGEIMVLAHASVLVQQGIDVFVLIDDGDARRRAKQEINWLQVNKALGQLALWSTGQVLLHASQQEGWIKGGLTWEAVYAQMRRFDDGLRPPPRR